MPTTHHAMSVCPAQLRMLTKMVVITAPPAKSVTEELARHVRLPKFQTATIAHVCVRPDRLTTTEHAKHARAAKFPTPRVMHVFVRPESLTTTEHVKHAQAAKL